MCAKEKIKARTGRKKYTLSTLKLYKLATNGTEVKRYVGPLQGKEEEFAVQSGD